ncbi:MAG: transcriptional regulator [Idiomarina sp.]|uniref:sigma-54-dependent transcriptional regulator n=1 Tax=Idiomarina sp. TaxID=1874361 RepID=UPI000C0D9E40|nr:sigma 54-interacting transcriptional regulator [Idiomarina sp.]MAK71018.1 transcriptional regulator [Idiomarinaceae bacterium]MBL4741887.1 sigma-54-dependent Fis family transcriptional regulator [Idiomarina sp.]MBT42832.1 transcriptional regulator [Idiomarina sp.]PHQ77482.1 MAG: transcriptional regulator [Idiomarina sp.]
MNVAEMKTQHTDDDIACRVEYVPTLIIALHPDLERVGETAPLLGMVTDERDYVSRNRPDFSKNGHAGKPLNDPHLSRSPVIIQKDNDDVYRIRGHSTSTRVRIEGRAQQSEYLLSQSDISSGVTITLSNKVVLLLKLLPLQDSRLKKDALLKGISPDIHALTGKLEHIAQLDIPVIIRGATGSGKEQAAYKIHRDSSRCDKPFVVVNLAAIHDVVAEEELFGVSRSGQTSPGYFSQAEGGTLVLEDLEDASEVVISSLFAALASGSYVAVNGDQQQPVTCRIIATSIYDACPCSHGSKLWQLTNLLAAYQVFLAPLGDRLEDVSILFLHFVKQQWQKIYPGRPFELRIPPAIIARILSFNWPGNVRQLRNVARQAVIDSREQESLQLDQQLLSILKPKPNLRDVTDTVKHNGNGRKPNTIGREELTEALQKNRFELQATARELSISRASVYQLIQRFDGLRTAQDLAEQELKSCYEKYRGDTEQMMWELQVSQVGMRRRLKAMGYDI